MKHSVRLTRSVFTATATVLQFWGELSIFLSRHAGPYIHGGQREVTTYLLRLQVMLTSTDLSMD